MFSKRDIDKLGYEIVQDAYIIAIKGSFSQFGFVMFFCYNLKIKIKPKLKQIWKTKFLKQGQEYLCGWR